MVDGEVAVLEEGDELDGETGHDLGVCEGEEVFGEDAGPEGGGAPVGAGGVVGVDVLGGGEAAAEEGDYLGVAVEKDDGEGDEEGEGGGGEEADDDLE